MSDIKEERGPVSWGVGECPSSSILVYVTLTLSCFNSDCSLQVCAFLFLGGSSESAGEV